MNRMEMKIEPFPNQVLSCSTWRGKKRTSSRRDRGQPRTGKKTPREMKRVPGKADGYRAGRGLRSKCHGRGYQIKERELLIKIVYSRTEGTEYPRWTGNFRHRAFRPIGTSQCFTPFIVLKILMQWGYVRWVSFLASGTRFEARRRSHMLTVFYK